MSRSLSPAVAKARGTVAAYSRSREDDDPDLVRAKTDLAAANLIDFIHRVGSSAPPLTPQQRDTILAAFAGLQIKGDANV